MEIHLSFLIKTVNYKIKKIEIPDKLENLEVIPLYKKENLLKKENYRPVSLLPHASKVFE